MALTLTLLCNVLDEGDFVLFFLRQIQLIYSDECNKIIHMLNESLASRQYDSVQETQLLEICHFQLERKISKAWLQQGYLVKQYQMDV